MQPTLHDKLVRHVGLMSGHVSSMQLRADDYMLQVLMDDLDALFEMLTLDAAAPPVVRMT